MSLDGLPRLTSEEHQLLNEFISERFGISFPEHRREILESRLRPRLQALRLARFLDYYLVLEADPGGEAAHLAHLVTNNETYFFREVYQFTALFEQALPELRRSTAIPGMLRILCAGCSSGEEPYTLGLLARDHAVALAGLQLHIDAIDIDDDRLAMARAAEFGPSSLRNTSEEQLKRYFVASTPGHWRLRSVFREGVSFAPGNILELAAGNRLPYDAIFCRNVLIYFSEPALHQAIDNFARILRRRGLLFLGHSESIISLSEHFEPVRLQSCIAYQRAAP